VCPHTASVSAFEHQDGPRSRHLYYLSLTLETPSASPPDSGKHRNIVLPRDLVGIASTAISPSPLLETAAILCFSAAKTSLALADCVKALTKLSHLRFRGFNLFSQREGRVIQCR